MTIEGCDLNKYIAHVFESIVGMYFNWRFIFDSFSLSSKLVNYYNSGWISGGIWLK